MLVNVDSNHMKESLSLLGLPMWVGLLYLLLGFASVKAEWHGELSFRSDYVYRGYSKSQGDPVVQGLIDYQSKSGFFGGLGLSQVNFNDNANANRAQLEIKPYLGGIIPLSVDWRAELSVSGYLYNGNVFGQNGDYAEFGASLHYQDWLSAKIAVAPNAYQRHTQCLAMNWVIAVIFSIASSFQGVSDTPRVGTCWSRTTFIGTWGLLGL